MIVRELVTRLGFTFDRTNLDKFERALVGFKTRVAVAVGTIGFAFKKVLDYADDFSNKVLKNSAIAKFANTSVQELDALQRVFQKFNIPTDKFQDFFSNITLGIKEASRGVNNQFRQLVTQSQGAIRLYIDGQLTTSKKAIDDIFAYIRSKTDESEKSRIVQNIFQVDAQAAQDIINLSNLTRSEFDKLVESEKRSIEQLKASEQAARDFKVQINQLSIEWNKFNDNVAAFAVPLLNQSLGGINLLLGKTKEEGVSSSLSFVHSAIEDFFASFRGEDYLSKVKRQVAEEDDYFKRQLQEYQINAGNNATITNNNKFEFNVPPGTDEKTANFFTEAIKTSLNSMWDEKTREVINNNPQVE